MISKDKISFFAYLACFLLHFNLLLFQQNKCHFGQQSAGLEMSAFHLMSPDKQKNIFLRISPDGLLPAIGPI